MEVQFGPNAADEPNLLYKLQRKIKVFNTTNPLPNRGYNLVTSSVKYGLVFIATPEATLAVYHLQQLIDKNIEAPQHFPLQLQEAPTHISVSCDQEYLAVTGGQHILVYQVAGFCNQNVKPLVALKTDVNPNAVVSALQWNPCIPDTIAMAFYDGTLLVAQANTAQVKKVQAKARCICWSPKGKQLVVGNSDGTLCQYKPDLSPMKTVPAPNIFDGAPVETVAIYWISTFQFAVVYRNAADSSRPAVTIVNTPKGGQAACLNYEDVCYSMGSARPWYYYLIGVPQWNLILGASSNSMEIATLGSADGANWMQWTQSDEARPELPLTDKKQENFPIGVCVDTTAVHQLPWGENDTLPHMPQLLVLSQTGLLTIFNMINLRSGAPQLCSPPQPMALPQHAMTSVIAGQAPTQAAPVQSQAPPQPPKQEVKPPPPAYSMQSAPASQPAPAQPFKVTGFAQPPAMQGFQALSSLSGQQSQVAAAAPIVVPTAQQAQPKPVATQPKPVQSQSQSQPQSQSKTPDANAALKAVQERANIRKANEELTSMLVKEVNDFQMDLYNFRVKTNEAQLQIQQELNSLDASFDLQSLNTEKIRKECSMEELQNTIVQLKLEMVRACAVAAEARSHSETKDHQWTQADPLSTKRLASVKKLAYYVQNQLQQAHKALDHKWNEMESKDAQFNKPGTFMIRPILDDVYQPLVKQQEIISRQQAVLKTMQKTMNECNNTTPVFRSTSLLRSTPFKKDPLSKLTKNILNMSIEQNDRLNMGSGLSNQKLEALRDMLSNHKTVKIKPVSMELTEHLATMRLNYEKSLKEKSTASAVKTEVKPVVKQDPVPVVTNPVQFMKPEVKEVKPSPISIPTFSPMSTAKPNANGLASVARTLFTEEPKQEPVKQAQTPQTPTQSKPFAFAPASNVPSNNNMPSQSTRSVLKNLLINKQNSEQANDANTFMGQKICSPVAFGASPPSSTTAFQQNTFASKPIAGLSNMMSKLQPQQPFAQISPKQESAPKTSLETGEPENFGDTVEIEKKDKQKQPFSVKNVPDLVKPNVTIAKVEKKEKSKENVEKNEVKTSQATSSQPSTPVTVVPVKAEPVTPSPVAAKTPTTPTAFSTQAPTFSANSAFSTSTSVFGTSTATTTSSVFGSKPASPSSVFATAKTESSPKSIFSTPQSTTSQSLFSPKTTSSIFGSPSSTASVFSSTATTQSIFSGSPTTVKSEPDLTATSQTSVFSSATTTVTEAKTTAPTVTSTTPTTTQAAPLFGGTTTTQTSVFASPATTTQSASIFSTSATTQASIFGSPTTTQSIFGSPTTTQASVFGAAPTATATQASIFGATATTQASVFGSPATTTQASIFGSTPSTSASVFGSSPATTQASVFGGTPTAQSVFGSTPASTQASVFGTASASPSSIFGSAATTTQSSIFGSPAATQASVFGSPAATQASIFGSSPATTQASIFGGSTPTTQASVFGSSSPGSVFAAATTTASSSLFGTANLFASASISTTTASPNAGGSIFGGGSSPSSSVFGGSPSNVFGGKAAFGQPAAATTSIFGGSASFGQKPATNLWAGATTSSGFGSSAFGQQTTTQAPSVFGTGSFSAAAPAQPFAAQPQTQGLFGSPQQQQSAPAFGGSPVFGAKPATFGQPAGLGSPTAFGQPAFGGMNKSPGFGAAAAFGSGATFGGAPAFGSTSPGKVFGGAAPGFGAATQSNSTFENLAKQETLTFGNLAQQSGPAPNAAPAFNTSPSFTGWRG